MASRVLLVNLNRCTTPETVFPLGLSHLNAALRRAGHETRWLDGNAESRPPAEVLAEFRPDHVGVSVRNIDDVLIRQRETYFSELADFCSLVRRVNPRPVILGGSGFSIFPQRLLELSGADFGICGEGEAGFVELIAALSAGGDYSHLPGLVHRRGGKIIVNPPKSAGTGAPLEAADRPAPVVEHYVRTSGTLNLQTQRGCAQRCCYCTYPLIEGRRHRCRPAETVAGEMAQLEAQGAKYVFIVDSVFNSTPRHVTEVCEALIRRRLRVRWGCFLRPQGLTPALMQLMARAGLAHIEFGSDSFCDPVLEAYGKRLTFDDIRRASELARRQRIDFCHYLICGGPGETLETLRTTYEHSLTLTGAIILAVVGMRIYPGTDLYERALRERRLLPEADLLTPEYYVTPELGEEQVFARLQEFSRRSPNWIAGDPPPGYLRMVQRLRARGLNGPLWSYFAASQRLNQAAPSATAG
jgi:radical SAM superfamily enzyme YgiQ (UPF0313 family)